MTISRKEETDMETVMQYATYALTAIGVLAFFVSLITQVIKETAPLKDIPTNLVALVVAIVVTLLAVVILCQIYHITLIWYYMVCALVGAFIVYLVATGGWERIADIWERTKYKEG